MKAFALWASNTTMPVSTVLSLKFMSAVGEKLYLNSINVSDLSVAAVSS